MTDAVSALSPPASSRGAKQAGLSSHRRQSSHLRAVVTVTDARMPERWLNDTRLYRLSGDAFKLYTMALMHAVANRTDGRLEPSDLEDLRRCRPDHSAELVKAGLWSEVKAGGWLILDFEATQTSRTELEVLDNARRRDREKKRRQRVSRGNVPGDNERDSTRTGQGQDRHQEGEPTTELERDHGWPTVAPLGARSSPPIHAEPPRDVWLAERARKTA